MSQLSHRDIRIVVPFVLILMVWIWGFASLSQYNVTWDEALGDFFFGERYLSFFTSFDPVYLDFQSNPYPSDRQPDLFVSPFKVRPWEYYPVANTLAAATSSLLSRTLGWLDPFDGFHAVNLLLVALFLWFFYRLLAERWGHVSAIVASGLLLTSPRVFCHMMANIKDFPLMVLYALTAMAFLRAFESGSKRGMVATGALLGLTLGTKANALFFPILPGLVLLGGLPEGWQPRLGWRSRWSSLLLAGTAAGVVAIAVMVALWPYLWADPVGRFSEHLRYIGLRKGITRLESFAPVVQAILLTTPLTFLLFFVVGLGPCVRRALRRDRLAILMLAWIPAVLGRYLLPQAVNFDGVRHFLELFPALAAIAGLGAATLFRWLGTLNLGPLTPGLASVQARSVLATLALVPGAWALLSTHPFQIAYWNALAGGAAGAYKKNLPQAGDYWGMSYRLGLDWLNENAEKDALLVVPVVEHAVRLVAPVRLRGDITLLPITTPFSPHIAPERLEWMREDARKRPLYVMFVERRDWMNELMVECLTRLEPVMAWGLDGAPVLRVYRYEPP